MQFQERAAFVAKGLIKKEILEFRPVGTHTTILHQRKESLSVNSTI